MRASPWIVLVFCLASTAATMLHATTPASNRLDWHGREYVTVDAPLDPYLANLRSAPHFLSQPRREAAPGYVARWQLDNDRLYLLEVVAWVCPPAQGSCRAVELVDLFDATAKAPWLADWYTGQLHLVLDRASCRLIDQCQAVPARVRVTLKAGKVTLIENLGDADPAGTAASPPSG